MTAIERLRAMADCLPPDALLTIPVATLRDWLGPAGETPAAGRSAEVVDDLTAAEAAAKLGRAASTVRGWCAAGRIPGAYRLNGREWRIPQARLREFLDGQGQTKAAPVNRGRRVVDIADWRKVKRGA